jgi:hypothetical protein
MSALRCALGRHPRMNMIRGVPYRGVDQEAPDNMIVWLRLQLKAHI